MLKHLLAAIRRRRGEQAAASSGLFNSQYYTDHVRGRADEAAALESPWLHYLRTGAFEGLDPGPGFDSDWYLANNPDVRSSGMNPLVHYVQHGLPEGRLPYHGAKPVAPVKPPKLDSVTTASQRLWGGFEHFALPELTRNAAEQRNSQAAWHLACWEYAHGNIEKALHWLQQVRADKSRSLTGRDRIGLGKCYTLLGLQSVLKRLLEEPGAADSLGSAFPYLKANSCGPDSEQRLLVINTLFSHVGLVAIKPRDPERLLALDNLAPEVELAPVKGEQPLISVVMAAYNATETLPIALDSLLAQTWTALEVIVVDDGSTDATAEQVQEYVNKDPRVRYLKNSQNSGAYASRNNGMRAAKGEFVTVHDSDDWSHPQKLERQMEPLLADKSLVASVSSWVRVTPTLGFVGSWMLGETFQETNHSSWLIRREVLDVVGLWDEVKVAADTEFLWRMEHHYGHKALTHVLFDVPLSFALSDDATLTRAKATHVKTVFHGLRRLYRESSRWWHRLSDGKPVMTGSRSFPVPLGILKTCQTDYDLVVAADFTVEGEALLHLLAFMEERVARGERLCLLHWPGYRTWLAEPIADEIFALCQEHQLNFAHQGMTLWAPRVILVDGVLWQYPLSQTVRIQGLKRVETTEGVLHAEQPALLSYFVRGGV